MGYNGTPTGEPHCCDREEKDPVVHREWSKHNEIHAEMNALLYLTKYPKAYEPETSTLYTLLAPCIECAKAIHIAGIRRVVVEVDHKPEGVEYLRSRGVWVRVGGPW